MEGMLRTHFGELAVTTASRKTIFFATSISETPSRAKSEENARGYAQNECRIVRKMVPQGGARAVRWRRSTPSYRATVGATFWT